MYQTSYEIAEEIVNKYDHLRTIEITTGMNGYPQGLHRGIIGFTDINEAEQVAKEFDGEVVELSRKGGWQLWQSNGRRYDMYDLSRIREDHYLIFRDTDEVEDEFREVLSSIEPDELDINTMDSLVSKYRDIRDAVEMKDDNQSVIVRNDAIEEFSVVDNEVMNYDEDVWENFIGVELHARDIEED